MPILRFLSCRLPAVLALLLAAAAPARAEPQHAIAMQGAPALPPGYEHFPYADPNAPKGGRLVLAEAGGFDSLNPFLVKGLPAAMLQGLVFESLLKRSWDEPFTLYGLLAATVETPPDRSWVEFTLDPRAKFQDGSPVTVADVLFSFEILRAQGRPNHRSYYGKARAEQTGPRSVRFTFGPEGDREMPLIMGLMPILPEARYGAGRFTRADLDAPLGSGPYRVASVEPNRSITYVRNPDYWAKDLPASRGQDNFDMIRIDYYRDENASFEAFKAGLYDVRVEAEPARWAVGYDFPALARGEILRAEIPHGRPSGMLGFALNTRRPLFEDRRVREALDLAFDFDWVNRTFYYGAYRRITSYFDNSDLAAHGPPGPREAALLAPYAGTIPADILARGYVPPDGEGMASQRRRLRAAQGLLAEAGWQVRGGRLVHTESGRPFAFEILIDRPDNERLALTWARQLERLGMNVSVRSVDSSQYEARRQSFDFDAIVNFWGNSLSPGNEQYYYWSQAAADTPGSRNYPGVRDPGVDAMIAALTQATTREDFVAAARALDRLLLGGRYVVPLFYAPYDRLAWRDHLRQPARPSLYGYRIETWWAEPQGHAKLTPRPQ